MSTSQTATQVKQAITNYYSNPTVWDEWSTMIQANPGLSEQAIYEVIQQDEAEKAIEIMQSASGRVLGYGYGQSIPTVDLDSSVNNFINSMDSNISKAEYAINDTINTRINPSIFKDAQTGDITMKSGAFKVDGTTGTVSTVATVADKISLGVVGVNLGAKLGRWIDETIYNSDPEFWDKTFPTINPQTWDTIATSKGGKSFIRTLFGIENNTATAYVDEDVLAYTYQMFRDMGMFNPPIEIKSDIETSNIPSEDLDTCPSLGQLADLMQYDWNLHEGGLYVYGSQGAGWDLGYKVNVTEAEYTFTGAAIGTSYGNYGTSYVIIAISENPFNVSRSWGRFSDPMPEADTPVTTTITFPSNGKTYYYTHYTIGLEGNYPNVLPMSYFPTNISTISPATLEWLLCEMINIGAFTYNPGAPGTENIPGSTQYYPDSITGTTPQQVKQQLKNTYPDLFNDSITETVLQPDGSIEEITYVPIPWVIETTDPNPETELQTLTSPITDPSTTATDQSNPEVSDNTLPQIINNPTSPTPQSNPDTGTGSSPIVEPITGSASSLWAVYNPTQQQVDDFGAWLWSSDFVEQIKKLFLDPMQSIIGIHKVFVTPSTSGTATIKCGYLDSNVSAKVVSDQYKTVDCGTVSLPEYFGNVFDYEPFTSVKCFLPFIGIVPLDVSFIMRSKINIKYKVDVFTGACLAEIKISRDGHKNIIYTYSGSAIVTYPVSSGSYAGVISSVIQAAMGVAMGSPTTVVSGILSAHADTSVNGSFSGCAGAMGGKIPYLIISRPQTRMARNVNNFIGLGANYTTEIQYCKGFFKVLDVHLHIEGAYDNEVTEILSLLKTGVLTDSEYDGFYYEPQVNDIEGITITENGRYTADGVIRGYNPITVNVSQGTLIEKTINSNGVYNAEDDNAYGYSKVTVNVGGGGSYHEEVDIITHNTGGNNASIYAKLYRVNSNNRVLIQSMDISFLPFYQHQYEYLDVYGAIRVRYVSPVWTIEALTNLEDTTTHTIYANGDTLQSWNYTTTIGYSYKIL